MKSRTLFLEMACAMGVHAVTNEAARKDHVRNLRLTAEAMADELGLKAEEDLVTAGTYADPRASALDEAHRTLATTREELAAAKARLAELEAQLEQATAPGPSRKAGGRP